VTVDEQLAAFGSVTVSAVDSVSGAPVNEFCLDAPFGYTCTTTGTVTETDTPPGRYQVTVRPLDDGHVIAYGTVEGTRGTPAMLTVSVAPQRRSPPRWSTGRRAPPSPSAWSGCRATCTARQRPEPRRHRLAGPLHDAQPRAVAVDPALRRDELRPGEDG